MHPGGVQAARTHPERAYRAVDAETLRERLGRHEQVCRRKTGSTPVDLVGPTPLWHRPTS